jgi:nicotinamide mononucleotide transporter
LDIFEPYKDYSTLHIVMEIVAVLFAIVSVLYSKNNNIKVYPTGIVSTLIFVYLLYQWELFGDMIINGYYLVMSVYGWYLWKNPSDDQPQLQISLTSKKDYQISVSIFLLSSIFVSLVYVWYERFGIWWSYVDILTTGLFFVGMYLLAKRKVEHWIFLILGDFISIPLYYFKGYTITAILFLIYTVIAIFGYLEWKKIWIEENL